MNSDIHQNVVVKPADLDWQESTTQKKALLDQVSWESSFLRIKPETPIKADTLSEGEEYLILEGSLIFHGSTYPAGSYFRFPPNTARELFSGPEGALLFLKQGHFTPDDTKELALKQSDQPWRQGMVNGLSVMPLHQHGTESIAFVKWEPNTQFNPHVHPGGEEIIVLQGTFHDEFGSYPTGTWLRNKPYSNHTPHTESDGALIYVKTGHLKPRSQS